MSTGGTIRKLRVPKVQISQIALRARGELPQAFLRSRLTVSVRRAVRFGWVTFETAPKVDEFEPEAETRSRVPAITPPLRSGKPNGASIQVPEGEWSVTEQLREERSRAL